jgi:hypothetical protein
MCTSVPQVVVVVTRSSAAVFAEPGRIARQEKPIPQVGPRECGSRRVGRISPEPMGNSRLSVGDWTGGVLGTDDEIGRPVRML